jgi:hypothetical protein
MKLLDFAEKLKHIENYNRKDISRDIFNNKYGYPHRPVLISNAFGNWKIREEWTLEKISNAIIEEIIIEEVNGENKTKKTISGYLSENVSNYYIKTNIHLEHTFFEERYFKHEHSNLFNCWYEEYPTDKKKKTLSWIYIGNKNTYTDIHRDIWRFGSWLYLISGLKLWFIYPNNYTRTIEKGKDFYGFDNVKKVLKSQLKPLIAIQRPGQMIYVPSNTFHWVYNVETSVAFTGNFLNETNYEEVKDFFKKSKNRNNKRFIDEIILYGFNKVNRRTYDIKN